MEQEDGGVDEEEGPDDTEDDEDPSVFRQMLAVADGILKVLIVCVCNDSSHAIDFWKW